MLIFVDCDDLMILLTEYHLRPYHYIEDHCTFFITNNRNVNFNDLHERLRQSQTDAN